MGAYQADFAGDDEAAHYVTGLMVRTFLTSGDWLEPMKFAQGYYDAYPKVALGHWPPGFYVIQALWTLLFQTSRVSLLLLMAMLAACCCLLTCRLYSSHIGMPAAIASSALFLSVPVMQYLGSAVMAEFLLLAWSLLAMLAYGKFLQSERGLHSALFGLFAVAAILTKANGFALALLPPVALLLSRKVRLARAFAFWLPLPIVAITCAPWYLLTFRTAKEGWQGSKNAKFVIGTVGGYNLRVLYDQLGLLILLLAAVGFYVCVARPLMRRETVSSVWSVAAAGLFASFGFHTLVAPVRDARHLGLVLLLVIVFAAKGLLTLTSLSFIPVNFRARVAFAAAVCVIVVYALGSFHVVRKRSYGAAQVAAFLQTPPYDGGTILVSSPTAVGEGGAIAESAMLAPRPVRRILRSSKLLASTGWDGRGYRQTAETPADVLKKIAGAGVSILVWQEVSGFNIVANHHLQVAETIKAYPERFQKLLPASSENTFNVYAITPQR